MACVPIYAGLQLVLPWLLGRAIGGATEAAGASDQAAHRALGVTCVAFASVALLETAVRYAARRLLIDASRAIEADLKDGLLATIQRLPQSWHDRVATGDLISRFTQDVEFLRFLVGPLLLHGGAALIVVPGGLIWLGLLSPWLLLSTALLFGALGLGLLWLSPALRRTTTAVQESIGAISQHTAESLSGIRALRSAGRELDQLQPLDDQAKIYLQQNLRLATLRARLNAAIHSARELTPLAVVILGAWQAAAGNLRIADLVFYLGITAVMVWPLLVGGWVVAAIHRGLAAAERLEAIFRTLPESDPTSPAQGVHASGRPTPRAHDGPRIELRKLTFTYPGSRRPALVDVSLRVEPGQRVALVGPLGSGKSTILALLLRLYDPPPGTVFVDGVDVLEQAPSQLRERFVVAPQEPFVFRSSLRDNLDQGWSPSEDELATCLAKVALDVDVANWPNGLATPLGERGVQVSGGQRQRITLARMLLAWARRPGAIGLCDDCLAAVDTATSRTILERLRPDLANQTMLWVAHRLETVHSTSDSIAVLEAGRLTAFDAPDRLVEATGGYYAQTWALQRTGSRLGGGHS